MKSRRSAAAATLMASISALAMVADATVAAAQPAPPPGYDDQAPPAGYQGDQGPPPGYQGDQGPPPGYQGPPPGYQGDQAPPQGQYAPPPPNGNYDQEAQAYSYRYAQWANQYCVQQHANNTAAGAVIGGVLGAALGAGLSGGRAGATIVGGALGAGTGAAVGSSASAGEGCPPGYVIRAGAPGFYYGAPVAAGVLYAPAWYNPWVFVNGGWVYRPYRTWYARHRGYWGPGYRRPY